MALDLSVEPAFVITRASVTFAFPDGQTMTLPSSHNLFNDICASLLKKQWKDTAVLVNRAIIVREQTEDEFNLRDGKLFWKNNVEIPMSLCSRILDSSLKDDPKKIYRLFSKRLGENPSDESRTNLFDFLDHKLPLTDRGTFLAYKAVTSNYRDKHTNKIDNRVGSIVEMLRAHVDANNRQECSRGLHVGTQSYVNSFSGSGDRIMIIEVDPADVVAVPLHDATKMRVCKYRVLGEVDRQYTLPTTYISIADLEKNFINTGRPTAKKRSQPPVVEGTNSSVVGTLFYSDLINYLEGAVKRGLTTVTVKNMQSRFKGVSSKSIVEMLIDLCGNSGNSKYIQIEDKSASPTNVVVKIKKPLIGKLKSPDDSERDTDVVVPNSYQEDVIPTVEDTKKKKSGNNQAFTTEIETQLYEYLIRRKDAGESSVTVKKAQSRFKDYSAAEIKDIMELVAKKRGLEFVVESAATRCYVSF